MAIIRRPDVPRRQWILGLTPGLNVFCRLPLSPRRRPCSPPAAPDASGSVFEVRVDAESPSTLLHSSHPPDWLFFDRGCPDYEDLVGALNMLAVTVALMLTISASAPMSASSATPASASAA